MPTAEISLAKRLAHYIRESRKTLVITGAGVSTEAGVPDYRSASGLWRQQMESLATPEGFCDRFDEFTEFYRGRIRQLLSVEPGKTHRVLADWQRRGLVHGLVTQNVDGLHQRAGSEVIALHGNIMDIRCVGCGKGATPQEYLAEARCGCGGKRRPGVILFGEGLPKDAWARAATIAKEADVLLVIGSSLQVSPANVLPGMAKSTSYGIIINREPTAVDEAFDYAIHEDAAPILERIDQQLQRL